jgi:hypothetical protein
MACVGCEERRKQLEAMMQNAKSKLSAMTQEFVQKHMAARKAQWLKQQERQTKQDQ